jgi:hypothetical protein
VAPGNRAFCQGFEAGLRRLSADDDLRADGAAAQARVLAQAKAFFAEMSALAPPAIAADWATLNGVVQAAADPRALDVADPAGQSAADNIEAWSEANCGFDPGSIG